MAALTYEGKVQESFSKLLNELLIEESDKELVSKLLDIIIQLSIKKERGEDITSNLNSKVNNFIDTIKTIQDEDK